MTKQFVVTNGESSHARKPIAILPAIENKTDYIQLQNYLLYVVWNLCL